MTIDEKLLLADKLVTEVWTDLVPDRQASSLAEGSLFEAVDAIASRIIYDVDQLRDYEYDVKS